MTEIRPIEDRERVVVRLSGRDGNAFVVMGTVRAAMREAGWTPDEVEEATDRMIAGNYDHLIQTVMNLCEVD